MNNFLKAFFLTALIVPCSAFASLYTFEYSGKLTDRVTPGFDFLDQISGVLTIDMNAGLDEHPSPFSAHYSLKEGHSDFVTGYVTSEIGINRDVVRFYNGLNAPGNTEPWWDAFDVLDSSVVNGIGSGLSLYAHVKDLDWLSDDNPTPLFFSDYSGFEGTALLSQYEHWIGDNGDTYVRDIAWAYYELDFARLSVVNASVAEPSAAILMVLSILGLLVRFRRGNTRTSTFNRKLN